MNTPSQIQAPANTFRKYYRPLEPILAKPKNRVYTATILSFLTVSLFVWYAIRPTIQTILELRREIHDNTIVNQDMETKISALVEAQANYQQIVPRLGLIKEAVPETPDMVELMVQLRNLADSVDATISGANVTSVPLLVEPTKAPVPQDSTSPPAAPPDTNSSPGVTTTPMTITIDGSYDSIKQFIEGIYTLRRIVNITDMSIVPHADANSPGTATGTSLTMTLRLNTYSSGAD